MIKCKNCGKKFKGNFCNNCGQAANTHKLTLHYLWHDIQHGLFHFDQGIYYSAKQLFFRPGHSIREFIEGKRAHHFKPISLVIVLATLYGLLYHSCDINLLRSTKTSNELSNTLNHWVATHFSWLTLATIPIYTLGTYICFKKQGYNYIELFVLNSFKASQRLIFHIITFPLIYYFSDPSHNKNLTLLFYITDVMLIYWTNLQFFNTLSFGKTLLLTIVSHLIFLAVFFVLLVTVLLILGIVS